MSTPNMDAPPPSSAKKPLIIAAYRYRDPSRKRRVKVSPDTPWPEFLSLLRSRLEISQDFEIEICDESDIGIVSVDDLMDNEVLVVKERRPMEGKGQWGYGVGQYEARETVVNPFHQSHDQTLSNHVVPLSKHPSNTRSRTSGSDPAPSPAPSVMMGAPQLSHFIQCNSFGYYFLAEADNTRLAQSQGRVRRAHCIVKVPFQDSMHTLETEAALLHRISHHKSIISPPNMHFINFSEDSHQRFLYSLSLHKQNLLHQVVSMGVALQAYVYPLYGATMATKIKNGLSPERVLKYIYQLVDVMHYLQQRGVVHQTLLPENIQVMSNDRVIVCNFETAVQADPNTSMMVMSGGMTPPSNCTGLCPEVLSAFARLRVDSETIDYSNQYPWMFGVLSIIVATGKHPLQEYPLKYRTEGHKMRYRSHHIQSLPNPEKYPPVFLKLVRRSMSCDPARRPNLLQILTILKRDPRILSLMTGNRLPNERGRRGTGGVASTEHPLVSPQGSKSISTSQQNFPSSEQVLYENSPSNLPMPTGNYPTPLHSLPTHTTANIPFAHSFSVQTSSQQRVNRLRMTKEPSQGDGVCSRTPASPVAAASAVDPFLPTSHNQQPPPPASSRDPWYTFGETTPIEITPSGATQSRAATVASLVPVSEMKSRSVQRSGSAGGFSDNFNLNLSREASDQSLPHSAQRSISARLSASTDQLSNTAHQIRQCHQIKLGRSMETLNTRTSTSSEGDLKSLQEFQYRRLLHSPNAASSQETSPTIRRGGDLEHLISPSSPELDDDQEKGDGEGGARQLLHVRKTLSEGGATSHPPESAKLSSRSQVSEVSSPAGPGGRSPGEATTGSKGVDNSTQNESSSLPSLGHLGNLSLDVFQEIPMLTRAWAEGSEQPHGSEVEPPTVEDTKSSLLLDVTSSASHEGGSEAAGSVKNVGLRNPSESRAGDSASLVVSGPVQSNSSIWLGGEGRQGDLAGGQGRGVRDLDVFPRALDSETNILDDMPGFGQMGPFTGASTPSSNISTATPGPVSSADSAELPRGYNPVMSPLPEASQELSNSMSQPTDPTSPSNPKPLSNARRSASPSSRGTGRQQTSSPFRHAALPTPSARGGGGVASGTTRGVSDVDMRAVSSHKSDFDVQSSRMRPGEDRTPSSVTAGHSREGNDHTTRRETLPSSSPTAANADISTGRSTPRGAHSLPRGLNHSILSVATATSPTSTSTTSSSHGTRPLSPLATSAINANGVSLRDDARARLAVGGAQQLHGNVQLRQAKASHHAHQRPDSVSHQNRISQDLEIMNMAISGMDSHSNTSFSQPVYSSRGGVVNETRGHRRGEHHSTTRAQGASRKQHSRHEAAPGNSVPTSSRASISNGHGTQQSGAPATSSGVGSVGGANATFRPITPVASGEFRTASAPITRMGEESSAAPRSSSNRTSRQQGHTGTQSQGDAAQSSRPTSQLQQGRNYQPPQVTADSYDYLPPYSPPTGTQTPPSRPRSQQQQHQPSVFMRETYPEPPPSYNEIFGVPSAIESRREHTRQYRPPREAVSLGRTSSSQSAQADSSPSSRQASRLSSLTNLFRRSRKNNRSTSENVNTIAVDDYTAQWVESYSHTPRPSSVMSHQHNASPLSRTSSSPDPASYVYRNPVTGSPSSHRSYPIPYRSPPPLMNPSRTGGGPRSALNTSLTHLPTDGHTRSQTSAGYSPVMRRSPKENRRPRPASSYIPQDYRTAPNDPHGILHQLSFSSTTPPPPVQGHSPLVTSHSRLVSPTNMSASCSNIATNQVKKGKTSSRSSLKRRGSSRAQETPRARSSSRLPPGDWVVSDQSSHDRGDAPRLDLSSATIVRDVVCGGQERTNSSVPDEQEGLPSQGLSGDNTSSTVVVSPQLITTPSPVGDNASLIPRASLTSSPVSHIASLPSPSSPADQSMQQSSMASSAVGDVTSGAVPKPSNVSGYISTASSPGGPVAARDSVPSPVGRTVSTNHCAVSNASSSINIALSGSSVLSQVAPDVSGSIPNLMSSNVRSSTNSPAESSQTNSMGSTRAAARLRAESRRRSLISAHSSSEENVAGHCSNGHTHIRPKRRRSQGAINSAEGQRSLTALTNKVVDGSVPGGSRSGIGAPSNSISHGNETVNNGSNYGSRAAPIGGSRGNGTPNANDSSSHGNGTPSNGTPSNGAPSRSRSPDQEVPIVEEVTIEVALNSDDGVKSCGHLCESQRSGQMLCCLCSRKRPGRVSPPAPVEGECVACTRRRSHEELLQPAAMQFVKPPTEQHQDGTAPAVTGQNPAAHTRKNCSIM